jgi:hypothetical protein
MTPTIHPVTGWMVIAPLERAPSDERLAQATVEIIGPLDPRDVPLVLWHEGDRIMYLREAASFDIEGNRLVPIGAVMAWFPADG